MKSFLKSVAATITGIIIMGIVGIVLLLVVVLSMLASQSDTAEVPDNSVLVVNLAGIMDERADDDPLTSLLGKTGNGLGLDQTLAAIEKAQNDDRIKGIYLEAGITFSPDSYASMQALRRQLQKFRDSGKWIVAYADTYTQGAYYLCSVANKVYLNPIGTIEWQGLSSQRTYYKDMLAKFGIKMQVFKVGNYKSAVEPYTSTEMSAANREQTTKMIQGIWSNITKEVSASRGITVAQLNAVADSFAMLQPTESLLKNKLVDALLYNDQVKKEVKKLLKQDDDEAVSQVSIAAINAAVPDSYEGDEVAVYYAYGDIVSTSVQGAMSRSHVIASSEVCPDLEDLMNDDDVKAVVIRINSGGGSAYASEQLWHQITELRKKKPVVVSMGGMAASGGYYMSSPANWIVAEPTTLTGSIGIFGMVPDGSGLLQEKLGLHYDQVTTNKHSDFAVLTRPFTADEARLFQASIDRGYQLFRQRVADGRHMKVDEVEKVAQGHVWLGQDALRIKLIDQIGYLDDAVKKAAQLAKLDDYHTSAYPSAIDWMESLTNAVGGGNYLDEMLQSQLATYFHPIVFLQSMQQQDLIQARMPYCMTVR